MHQIITQEKIDFLQKNGYVIFKQLIPHDLIEQFTEDFNQLLQQNQPLKINSLEGVVSWQDIGSNLEKEISIKYGRFIDIDKFSLFSKKIILYPLISEFLTHLYHGDKPTSLQSLTYKYSSQQGEHSDRYLVKPDWAGNYQKDSLIASWIALEDTNESNGALIIYPGSHLIADKKKLTEDFDNNYLEYVKSCQEICQQHNINPEYFYTKKGDVLFWHGDFIHAGGTIKDWKQTRFSIVCHYANIEEHHFPLSLKNYRFYRQRVKYKNLGYFYQDLPQKHFKRDLFILWDKILIKQRIFKAKIVQVIRYLRIYFRDKLNK